MIIHEAIVINVREADDLKIAQHFSAGTRRVSWTEPVKTGDRKAGLCVARPFLSSASRTSLGTALARHVNE